MGDESIHDTVQRTTQTMLRRERSVQTMFRLIEHAF
jgi:hypothetical protein